jgi:hypothetical protein
MTEPIKIEGLAQFQRNLKTLDRDLPKALRLAFNAAADIVVADARPRVPSKSGKAKGSVKAKSSQTAARVVGGSKRVPYYAWLDFGGRVGPRGSIQRPFQKEGRYIYAAYFRNRDSGRFQDALEQGLLDVARQAGIELD